MQYNIQYGTLINTISVVSLSMAKKNSNIESDHEDDLLKLLLDAAVEEAQNYLDGPIQLQNVAIQLSEWPVTWQFPLHPVKEVLSVAYLDENGANQNVSVENYTFYSTATDQKIKFTWANAPRLEAENPFPITINCTAGYDFGEVPLVIKKAVLLRFSFNERYREEIPTSVDRTFHAALRPLKKWG